MIFVRRPVFGRALATACVLVAMLSGCADKTPQATDAEVAMHHYVSDDPPSLTLVTSVRVKSQGGVHSALIINGPERAVFNPAGTWRHPQAPEQGDFHVGFSPAMEKWYFDYHARVTFDIYAQTIEVPPEVAAKALELARTNGSVWPGQCTVSIAHILQQLPGFEDFPSTLYPSGAMEAFAKYPGVTTRVYTDDSPDDWSDLDLDFND
ncbi:MAG: hypothetical protein JNK88_05525 [Mangrovicoccus sp.]|nr:hypothetical protein [Mangrovicoccus sp.]